MKPNVTLLVYQTALAISFAMSIFFVVPLCMLIYEMRARNDNQIKSLITMSAFLLVYNLTSIWYYGLLFAGSFYNDERQVDLLWAADIGYAINVFLWLQVHWIFAEHYLSLGKNLSIQYNEGDGRKSAWQMSDDGLKQCNIVITGVNLLIGCVYWVVSFLLITKDEFTY